MLVHIFDDIVNTHTSYRQQFQYKTTMTDFPGKDSTCKEKNLSFYIVLLDQDNDDSFDINDGWIQ